MKRILTHGTFDLLHIGHVRIIKRAKSLGDKLIVGLSSDEFNSLKGKKAVYSYQERKEILESLEDVDLVIKEDSWEQKIDDIKKFNIDILVMGNDWDGKFDYLKKYCKVLYLKRTENISTTEVREDIVKNCK